MNKISVIVPVYNAEKYIEKLIKSIENQEYSNYEIILINDGSKDKSLSIIKKLAKENDKIIYKTQENVGPGLSRKRGFLEATGDLIFFVDSDDWIPNQSFIEIDKLFKKYNPDVLIFDRLDYIDGVVVEQIKPIKSLNKSGKVEFSDFKNSYITGGLGCKIFKKSILTEDMFINGYNYEDFATTYLYLNKCKNIYYSDKCFYCINSDLNNNSLTKNIDCNKILFSCDVLFEVNKRIRKKELKESICILLVDRFKNLLRIYLNNILKFNMEENKKILLMLKKIKKEFNNRKIKNYTSNNKLSTRIMINFVWILL